jgi:hypothetical protein
MRDHDAREQLRDVQLDALLESLLSNYSAAEPRPGLEKRLLANLRQAHQAKPRLWIQPWLLEAGAALASLVLLVFLLLQARPSQHPAPIQAHGVEERPKGNDVAGPTSVSQVRTIARSERASAIIQKVDDDAHDLPPSRRPPIFPTPVPLSEQEGFMFLYLANTPKEELIAQSHRDEEKNDDGFWDDGSPSSSAARQSGHIR